MKPPAIVEFFSRLTALEGRDHWPSFVKLVVVTILASYLFARPIPPEVAIIAILSSQGGKSLVDYLSMRYQGVATGHSGEKDV